MQAKNPAPEKKALRRRLLARRSAGGGAARAQAALRHARGLAAARRGCVIGLYAGFRDELDPTPLIWRLWRAGFEIALPVVVGPARPLVFRRFSPDMRFTRSAWGIAEPEAQAPDLLPDLVFAPLLGIDRMGVRLGYGGGFYDRTLAGWRARGRRVAVFGLAFECQLVSRLPRGAHDMALDGLVTEAGVRRFR